MKVIGTDELVPEDLLWCAYCCRYSMYPDRGGLSCTTCRSVVGRPVVDQFPLTQRPEDAAEIARLRAEVSRLTAESEGRRLTLIRKSDDLRAEWTRAEKAEARVMELEEALSPFARAYANFRAVPVNARVHPRCDPIVCGFDVWRNADAAMLPPDPSPCATCGGFHRICRCHGEQPHPDCVDLIDCPDCVKDGAK